MISPTLISCLYTKHGNTDISSQGKCTIFKWDRFYYNFVLFNLIFFSPLNSDRLFEHSCTGLTVSLTSSECSHGHCDGSSDAEFSPSSIHPVSGMGVS